MDDQSPSRCGSGALSQFDGSSRGVSALSDGGGITLTFCRDFLLRAFCMFFCCSGVMDRFDFFPPDAPIICACVSFPVPRHSSDSRPRSRVAFLMLSTTFFLASSSLAAFVDTLTPLITESLAVILKLYCFIAALTYHKRLRCQQRK